MTARALVGVAVAIGRRLVLVAWQRRPQHLDDIGTEIGEDAPAQRAPQVGDLDDAEVRQRPAVHRPSALGDGEVARRVAADRGLDPFLHAPTVARYAHSARDTRPSSSSTRRDPRADRSNGTRSAPTPRPRRRARRRRACA